jgi:hypothetical protein
MDKSENTVIPSRSERFLQSVRMLDEYLKIGHGHLSPNPLKSII